MFGNLMSVIAWIVGLVLQGLMLVIFLNAILSWFRMDSSNALVQLLDRISDFVCNPIRRLFPTVYSGLDFAPMIALVALMALYKFLVPTLEDLARNLR